MNLSFYRSRGQKSKMGWQGWILLEALGEKPFPCLFQLLEALPTFPGFWQHHSDSASITTSLSQTLALLSPSNKNLVMTLGPLG